MNIIHPHILKKNCIKGKRNCSSLKNLGRTKDFSATRYRYKDEYKQSDIREEVEGITRHGLSWGKQGSNGDHQRIPPVKLFARDSTFSPPLKSPDQLYFLRSVHSVLSGSELQWDFYGQVYGQHGRKDSSGTFLLAGRVASRHLTEYQ
ncbi:Hypothetical protein NTJ_05555 [Nesidiocoris tenuis]|uniref:Uncharacterized protein n=1 Tax=Nesidiocoris tenuis TaxID=355587 RepID=A0ABN7APD2_9HEMI|nr:Hypothetical protein NTJ_05555 [Nesidiocoris tenuis]